MNRSDPTDIRSREKQEAIRKEAARKTAEQEAEDFKWIMADKRGRRVVWGLLERSGLYKSSFTGNSETFFREGARNVGLQYMALIHEHCPEKYNLMVSEQKATR